MSRVWIQKCVGGGELLTMCLSHQLQIDESIICTLDLVMVVISVDSISTEDDRRRLHMSSLGCDEGSPHLIRRENIYEDVVKLYGDFQ